MDYTKLSKMRKLKPKNIFPLFPVDKCYKYHTQKQSNEQVDKNHMAIRLELLEIKILLRQSTILFDKYFWVS